MKNLSVAIIVLFSFKAYSQNNPINIKGKIVSEENPIAFVNIGIVGKNIGTVADESGLFEITILSEFINEPLRFSCVGFETEEYSVAAFLKSHPTNPVVLKMREKIMLLEPVVIKYRNSKTVTLGSKSESIKLNAGFPSNKYLGSEIGSKFNFRGKKGTVAFIEEFSFFVVSNVQDDTVTMRLNIYALDDDKIPTDKLINQDIILTIPNKSGWVITDLTPYNIYTTDDFVIALEWIKYKAKNSRIRFSSTFPYTGKLYLKIASHGKWWVPIGGPVSFNVKLSYHEKD